MISPCHLLATTLRYTHNTCKDHDHWEDGLYKEYLFYRQLLFLVLVAAVVILFTPHIYFLQLELLINFAVLVPELKMCQLETVYLYNCNRNFKKFANQLAYRIFSHMKVVGMMGGTALVTGSSIRVICVVQVVEDLYFLIKWSPIVPF